MIDLYLTYSIIYNIFKRLFNWFDK